MNVVAGAGPEVIKVSDNCSSPVRSDQWPVSVSQYLILPCPPLQPLAHWSTSPVNIGRQSGFNLITIHSSIIQISPSSLLWAADTWLVAVGLIEISGNKTVWVRSTPTPTAQFRTKVPASNMNILLQSTLLAMAYISGIRGISNMEPMSRKEFCKKNLENIIHDQFQGMRVPGLDHSSPPGMMWVTSTDGMEGTATTPAITTGVTELTTMVTPLASSVASPEGMVAATNTTVTTPTMEAIMEATNTTVTTVSMEDISGTSVDFLRFTEWISGTSAILQYRFTDNIYQSMSFIYISISTVTVNRL